MGSREPGDARHGGRAQDPRQRFRAVKASRGPAIAVLLAVICAAGFVASGVLGGGATASGSTCTGALSIICGGATTTTTTPTTTAPLPSGGKRITVALFGDSVTQSIAIPNFETDGLAGQVEDQLTGMGYAQGGIGLLPAVPYFWTFNESGLIDQDPLPDNGWWTEGYGKVFGHDGPNGYSAMTPYQDATATVTVTNPLVTVLYTTTPYDCSFTVDAGKQTYTIDTYRAGNPAAGEQSIVIPSGKQTITVNGPDCGEQMTFDGIVDQAPAAAGTTQIEVDNLGHAAHMPWLDYQPRVKEALIEQRYNLSVFLWGFIAELLHYGPKRYITVMEQRAQIAKMNGGACLIVQPAPIDATAKGIATTKAADQTVAKKEGCTYTSVLAHIWPSYQEAESAGLLIGDGVHPTAAGYKTIAAALAPVIAKVLRTHKTPAAPSAGQ